MASCDGAGARLHQKLVRNAMSIDDPRLYQRYEEDVRTAQARLEFAVNIERLQDEMRRLKQGLSFQAFADLIPQIVAEFAPGFPRGSGVSSQNLYDFLKLKSPSIPSPPRRLAYHAFMMVVDETYREKWRHSHFVRRAGLTLTQLFATDRAGNPYDHAVNRQASAGLYTYRLDDLVRASIGKSAFDHRCLLLTAPKDLPFLLAYDFDVSGEPDAPDLQSAGFADQQIGYIRDSWDLDARVGFYIPKRARNEGIVVLNSYKWDWPTVYGSLLNYGKEPLIDHSAPQVTDLLLTDVNSFLNIARAERSYLPSDYEIADERKLFGVRQTSPPESLSRLSALLERKFDWGTDL